MIKAVIFDFDGVIAESVDIKSDAFAYLFKDHPQAVGEIVEYHLLHGGLSRLLKFDHIYNNILRKPLSENEKVELGRQFSDYVMDRVVKCPYVSGAKEFIEDYAAKLDLYIVSGTPQNEMRLIAEKRGLSKYFKGIFGSPEKKEQLIQKLIDSRGIKKEEVVFIGDSTEDYVGARTTGIKFVGRIGESNPFVKEKIHATVKDINEFRELLVNGKI